MPDANLSNYFYGDESQQFTYYRIPRQLITSPRFKHLSTDSKLLYSILLDRMCLSIKNHWYDADGRVYIYYTVEEICSTLNCGRDKAMKLLAELDTNKGVGLIERIKQGQGKPTRIYVLRFTTGEIPDEPDEPEYPEHLEQSNGMDIPFARYTGENLQEQEENSMHQDGDFPHENTSLRHAEAAFPDLQKSCYPTSASRGIRRTEAGKPDGSYNKINQTDLSYTDPSIYPHTPSGQQLEIDRCEAGEEVKENIDYDLLREEYPLDDIESIVELLTDVLSGTAPTIRIGGQTLPIDTVKKRFRQLERENIAYVIDSLKQTTTRISNIRAYLLTALYNAPVTIGPYYSAAVRHDFG